MLRALPDGRLTCLHLNDSQAPLGSNRDRHAPIGEGVMGPEGCAVFLSEPAFEGLPAVFEGPGQDVQHLLDWAQRGPSHAVVADVVVQAEQPEGLSTFRIR